MVTLNVVLIPESLALNRLPSDYTDEQEHDCHNQEDVQPSAEGGRRNHPKEPQHDEQDDEKHQHGVLQADLKVHLYDRSLDNRRGRPSGRPSRTYAATTRLRRMPIPSTSVSITSPTCSHSCGVRPIPTPSGVPVEMMSPGSSVQPRDSTSMV